MHGKCVSGGLLLCWPCDIIIASDDAQFQEVTVAMGIAGVEWFAHPWEMGARKAKEMLMTGAPIGAEEARQIGMVNKVVPRDQLEEATLEMARTIARQPTFATKMAKMAVNAAQDAQGRHAAHAGRLRTPSFGPLALDGSQRLARLRGRHPFECEEELRGGRRAVPRAQGRNSLANRSSTRRDTWPKSKASARASQFRRNALSARGADCGRRRACGGERRDRDARLSGATKFGR